jgi:hypothetical protein
VWVLFATAVAAAYQYGRRRPARVDPAPAEHADVGLPAVRRGIRAPQRG